jgi:hypothetical protein
MPPTEADSEGVREFRALLDRLQWPPQAFARAASIKTRTARAMHEGRQKVPPPLMRWLRSMVEQAETLPPAPDEPGEC